MLCLSYKLCLRIVWSFLMSETESINRGTKKNYIQNSLRFSLKKKQFFLNLEVVFSYCFT